MKTKKYILAILFVVALFGFMPISNAGNLSISFSNSNAKVGDTVTATIKGNGVSGKVNLSISGNATLSTNSVFVDGSASVTVKINGEGNIKVTATAADMAETSNAQVYNGSTSGTIKVASNSSSTSNTGTSSNNNSSSNKNEKNTETTSAKSNNANLSSLGIKPNDFKGFKASKTSYDVTVPSDTEKVTVYATAQDKKATIKGNGTQKLNQGKNSLNVVVTAEDGTTKTYTINVTREEGSQTTNDTNSNTTEETTEITDDEENQEDSVSDLKSLSIKGFNLEPAFSPDVYEYKVNVNGDMSSLDIETEGANHSVSIDIVGNENLTDGENTITLLVYNDETKQNSTYQITVNKTSADVDGLDSELTEAVKKANKIRCIIIGVVVFIIVGIVVFIVVKHRFKAKTTNNKMYEYDDEDKDKLNLDDEDEFFNRVNNQKNEKSVEVENNVVEKTDKTTEVSEYDVDDYFRTNKPKKKGKHF